MNEIKRADVKIGLHVKVIMKEDQLMANLPKVLLKTF